MLHHLAKFTYVQLYNQPNTATFGGVSVCVGCMCTHACTCCTSYSGSPTPWGQKWLTFSSVTDRCRKISTVFFLMGFHGWLTFRLNPSGSYFANVCYSTFLSLFDPASPWIFDTKLKHYKPRDKFYPGCKPRRSKLHLPVWLLKACHCKSFGLWLLLNQRLRKKGTVTCPTPSRKQRVFILLDICLCPCSVL